MAVEGLQTLSERRFRDIVAFCADEEYHAAAQDHIRGLITMSGSGQVAAELKRTLTNALVQLSQKAAGLLGLLACLNRPRQRGSKRLARNAQRRGMTMYEGLAGSERTKRSKGGKQGEPDQVAARSEISKDVPSTEPGDIALGPTRLAESVGVIDPASGYLASGGGPPSGSVPTSEDGPTPGGGPTSGDHQTLPATTLSTQDDVITDAAGENGPLPAWSPAQMEDRFGADITSNTMTVATTILFDCARLSYALVPIPPHATIATHITNLDDVRRAVKEIAGRPWNEAATAIMQYFSAKAAREILNRYVEAYYWLIIKDEAKTLNEDELPTPKGRLTEFSRAEKAATERFMARFGYGTSAHNQAKCRKRWKRLHEMREAGVEKLLHYRNSSLDNLCESWPAEGPQLHEIMLAWEGTYRPHILRLEAGAGVAYAGGPAARVWLGDLAGRLKIPDNSWNADKNNWFSVEEKRLCSESVKPTKSPIADGLRGFRDIDPSTDKNKSLFVSPLAKDQESLAVVTLVRVNKGDLLGLFSGELRYSGQFDKAHGIRSDSPNLWLDSSRVTGPLNQMRVTRRPEEANVVIGWQGYHEIGKSDHEWRVVVKALRTIQPWEELVRQGTVAQHLLYQDAASAKRGFLEF